MACIESGLGEHAPSPRGVVANEPGIREPHPDHVSLQCSSSRRKEVEPWGHHRQLERPSETAGACNPVDSSRAHKHPYGPPPAVAEESQAWLAGWRLRDTLLMCPRILWQPSRTDDGGQGSPVGAPRGGNNPRLFMALPQGQGFFPQVRGLPHIPTIRSGVMMELPLGNTRMTSKERLAHVSFPQGGPRPPLENWPRSLSPLFSSTPGLPSCPTAHCFILSRPLSFSPFLAMPIAFAPPPIFGPPLPSYFANFPS
ncbi:unnamed protein product [Nyctereutes procyonoides]|uniref:(raccoon dog) hypothetical protein n=1 Tax=Nyctereutes procyonoides TaxID=34880 RepID=A0A811ZR36_NYCPR|nr:unnamed protein product [Nyctereutes procyonoides]